MSLYTTEVRYICEKAANYEESQGYKRVNDILNTVWDKVIPQDWPIFDEDYRAVLCKKILKHYYTREIGLETVGLWQLKLETKLSEIMPYYNELYKTALLKYDPFRDVDYYTEHEGSDGGSSNEVTNGENDTTSTSERTIDRNESGVSSFENNAEGTRNTENDGTNSNVRWDKYNDTPQGPLEWNSGEGQALNPVEAFEYLTNARQITDNGAEHSEGTETREDTQSGSSTDSKETDVLDSAEGNVHGTSEATTNKTFDNTNEYLTHIYGKMSVKSYMSIIKEMREIILNIDMMIIEELSDLFVLLWR